METSKVLDSGVRLFGDATATVGTGTGTVQAGIGDLTVSRSGQSIVFTPRGPKGDALPIAAVRSSDDVQVLQVVGATPSSNCTLTFNGMTTPPIPLQPMPPLTSFVWQATLPKAGAYNLGLAWGNYGWPDGTQLCRQALVEVLDSGVVIGTATVDLLNFPDPSVDIAVSGTGIFRALGSFTFKGTSLQVRLSGPAGSGNLLAATLRVAPQGTTDPDAVGYIDPSPNRAGGSNGALEGSASTTAYGNWTLSFYYTQVGSWHGIFYAQPTGTAATKFPLGSDVATALQALRNVPPGSIKVNSPSNQSISVQFTGVLGGQSIATMTCSESAIQVVHDGTAGSAVGGAYPSASVNGVAHVLQASSFAPGKPNMMFHLVQDAPAVQYQRYLEGLFQNNGYFAGQDGIGYGNRVGLPTQGGPLASWRFQGLAGPADFQVDITWPGGDASADVLQCVVLDGNGNTLGTVSGIDQTKAPADSVDSAGVGWKSLGRYTLSAQINALTVQAQGPGTQGKHIILDTVRLTRVSPDRGVVIKPGDDVRFTLPANFVSTCNGPVPAVAGVMVKPAPATRLPAIPPGPKSMKVGTNCDWPIYYGNDSCFANMAIQASKPIGLAQSAAGNPTLLGFDGGYGCGTAYCLLTQPPSDASGRGYGVPNSGPGVWVLQWTGSPWNSCVLESLSGSTKISEIQSRRVTGAVNRRYYQIDTTSPASPSLVLRFLSSQKDPSGSNYTCDVANVAVYPPDVDPNSTSLWRPSFLRKLRNLHCFRFMDMLGTNDMNLAEFSHFPDQANFPLGYTGRTISVPIASIGPPTPDPFAESVGGTVVRVTTKVPHGLNTGFFVALRTTDGSSLGQVVGNVIDGKTNLTSASARDPLDPTDGYQGRNVTNMCHVIDATTIQIGVNAYYGPTARMTNTLTPANGYVYAQVAPKALMGPADAADLTVVSGLEAWVNVPWLATDDCVTKMAQVFAGRLPKGRIVHVEYGNEPWNFAFSGFAYCVWAAKQAGIDYSSYVPYYTKRMGEVHKIFRDVWAKNGRDPLEVRRVCGVQEDNPGGTSLPCMQYALANGISFDELAPASYYSNMPAAGPADDLLTREQLLDLFAVNLQQSDLPGQLAAHIGYFRDAFASNPSLTWLRDVVLVNYEGGPDTMTTTSMSANIAARNHGVHRHPDFCEIEMNHLQMLEDAGVKLFNIFSLYGTRDGAQWGMYEGYQMEAGTGDATIDLANVNDFENLPAIKSETAAALMKWSAMVPRPAPPVLRNGKVGSYGALAY